MSRSEFVCYRCRSKVANIRSDGTTRYLTPLQADRVTVCEDGRILLFCRSCGTPNQFTWRAKERPAATLATQEAQP